LFLYLAVVLFGKVTIVGVGLLGGSLGMSIKRRRLAGETVGFVRREASVRECRRLRVVDGVTRDVGEAVSGADLIVLCTPLSQMRPLVKEMLPVLKRGAIVTDVGSVKAKVVRELEPLVARAGAHFIGSHPMAGSERTGVAAARADLFLNAVCVVTPTRKSAPAAVRKVARFWEALGCDMLRLSPEQHDVRVSRSSHLPHVVAATLVRFVLNPAHPGTQARLCANGFRDATRIASGSPEMWRDIALDNRRNLVRALDAFAVELRKCRRRLRGADPATIMEFFEHAKRRRDAWCARCVSASPE
jgi:prephenate dehydrogenase